MCKVVPADMEINEMKAKIKTTITLNKKEVDFVIGGLSNLMTEHEQDLLNEGENQAGIEKDPYWLELNALYQRTMRGWFRITDKE